MAIRKLYAAYGANTHREHMASRCPAAKSVGRAKLFGHRLAFRGVADVVRDVGAHVVVALWEITPECERSLDRFEGFPNLYVKRFANIRIKGRVERVMFYVMRDSRGDTFSPPPRSYEMTLRAGYAHFGMKHDQIDAAIAHAREINGDAPFRSKWHRIDAGEESTKPTARVPAKMRPRAPESRAPIPEAWEQWRFDSFDERLRKARARPLPKPALDSLYGSEPERDPRLLAVPFDRVKSAPPRRGAK